MLTSLVVKIKTIATIKLYIRKKRQGDGQAGNLAKQNLVKVG